jgi:hypothetical protein
MLVLRRLLLLGLVPLALLAALAWAQVGLRPGAAAAFTLLLAPLGVAMGAEAIHCWREVGLSGDDYTGLLAIPAGVTLLAVGARTQPVEKVLGAGCASSEAVYRHTISRRCHQHRLRNCAATTTTAEPPRPPTTFPTDS